MPSAREADLRQSRVFAERLRALSGQYRQGGPEATAAVELFEQDWGQIQKGQGWAAGHWTEEPEAMASTLLYLGGLELVRVRQPSPVVNAWVETALAIARDRGDRGVEIELLNLQGSIAYDQSDYAGAERLFYFVLLVAQREGWRFEEVGYLHNLGSVQLSRGKHLEAIATYDKAVEMAREVGGRALESDALGNLGIAHAESGDPAKAVDLYRQALTIARETGNPVGEEIWLGNLGNALFDLGDREGAAAHLEEALSLAEQLGDWRKQATRLGNLANLYADLDDLDRAVELHQRALDLSRKLENHHGTAVHLHGLGVALGRQERFEEAAEYLRKSADLFFRIGAHHLAERSQQNLDALRTLRGRKEIREILRAALDEFRVRREDGLRSFEQALQMARDIGDQRSESMALGDLGFAFMEAGEQGAAEEFLQAALAISQEIGASTLLGNQLGSLGNLRHVQGLLDEAAEHYAASAKAAARAGDRRTEAFAKANLGNLAAEKGLTEEAREHLRRARELFSELRMADILERTEHALAQLSAALGLSEDLASDIGLFVMNRHLDKSLEQVTVVGRDGRVISGYPAQMGIGAGYPDIRLALGNGKVVPLDFTRAVTITVRLRDGRQEVFEADL